MKTTHKLNLLAAALVGVVAITAINARAQDPLPSWNDGAVREFAYGAESKIGTFSDALMTEAKDRKWTVISMKDDWKKIFAFEQ